jgi:rhamnose utilization protein RhaD (predicted bifunctional aldolase and dehydrogenase)
MREFELLKALSAELGTDEMLVQAGGGNTSVKTESGLWIKASGTRLADARDHDIFVFLSWPRLEEWAGGNDEALTVRTESGKTVRASVETAMHLSLPHRFVAHTHSVRAISWLVQQDSADEMAARLAGFRLTRIPYIHPGRTLAHAIRELTKGREIDVLLLENHGLVVGADDKTELIHRVQLLEDRLERPIRESQIHASNANHAEEFPGWISVPGTASDIAFHPDSLTIAGGGTLYPDHCVYLGPSVAVAEGPACIAEALSDYRRRYSYEAKALLIAERGAFLRTDARPECGEMLRCMGNVIRRIPSGARITYLNPNAVQLLMNWDAEAYRLQIAAEVAAQRRTESEL